MPIILKNLTHTYMPNSPFSSIALNDISLTIQDGELVGLLGHTGSGKTTFVQHINGLLKPTSGTIEVDGLKISEKGVNLTELRKKVGLVFQYPEYQLFEETVAKDIAFGPKNLGCSEEEINKRVKLACLQVGLSYEEIAECSPFELSGGQMRRVAIAGVLAMQPSVLILDEPTAGLDPAGRTSILNMIRTLHSQGNITIIMVSHSMDDIATLATRLIIMNNGSVALQGTPKEIFLHEQELQELGLDVPQASSLTHKLNSAGFSLPNDLYTLPQVRDAILALWNKGEV